MKAFNTITSALAGTALLASSVLAQLDPIVIKVGILRGMGIVLGFKTNHMIGVEILLQNQWDRVVSVFEDPVQYSA